MISSLNFKQYEVVSDNVSRREQTLLATRKFECTVCSVAKGAGPK